MVSLRAIALVSLLLMTSCTVEPAPQTAKLLTTAQAAAVPVKEAFATTPDGVRIYYRVAGTGEEVVIAPFALFHGSALDRLAVGRRIVTYDPRGRGRSQAVSLDKVSLDGLLMDLDTVRRAVGADRAAMVGWSAGGMETFVYALRNPGRVTRLVQLAPVGVRIDPYSDMMVADREKRTDKAALAKLEQDRKSGSLANDDLAYCREYTRVALPALFFDRTKAGLIPEVCTLSNELPDAAGAYFNALFKSIDGYDWRPELANVKIPRLVIYPLQDNIPLAGNEEWVRGQQNARILLVDHSGHFPHYEQPEATLSAIASFLDGKWPPEAQSLPSG